LFYMRGICRLCGAHGELSFEHVPPRSAFNNWPVFRRTFDQCLQEDGPTQERGRIQQRGFGDYTLCESCNNTTGSWYGPEYVDWARRVAPIISARPTELGMAILPLAMVRPLRFLKQCLTCLFSVNPPGFGDSHPALREFILNRSKIGLPPKYDFYLGTNTRY